MKLILQILLILTIITTISICAIKPDMHKNVMVYDSAYTLVTEEEVKTETKEIPVMEKTVASAQTIKTTENAVQVSPDKNFKKIYQQQVQTQNVPKQTTTTKQTVTKPVTQTVKKPETITVEKPTVTTQTKKVEQPNVQQNAVNHPIQTIPARVENKIKNQPKVLTQQEETIAWNKWRSDLTNKIMQDTKMPDIPSGTVFSFSFNVDRYGKVSNVQTGASPANYTPYAIQYIAPVIRSYQGKSILNFPEGTARTSTTVTGKWRISNTARYSTPQDYNDIERVTKY